MTEALRPTTEAILHEAVTALAATTLLPYSAARVKTRAAVLAALATMR